MSSGLEASIVFINLHISLKLEIHMQSLTRSSMYVL